MLAVQPLTPSIPLQVSIAGPISGYPDRENPVARLQRNRDNRYTYWRAFGDAYVNLSPFKGFNLRSTLGLDYAQKMQRIFTYPITEGNVANSKNAVEPKQEHWTKWMEMRWLPTTSISAKAVSIRWPDGGQPRRRHLVLSLQGRLYHPVARLYVARRRHRYSPKLRQRLGYSLVSYFGKVNYNYADRYLASFTIRHDGSSRFGKNNRYATFPAVTLGWRVNQEKFLKHATWIDDLKLRASWGQTGNQEISNIARYTIYVSNYGATENGGQSYGTSYDIAGTNGGQTLPSGFKRKQFGNDNIKWETTTQTNLGLDYAFLGNTLYGTFDWYYKKTKDILVSDGRHRGHGRRQFTMDQCRRNGEPRCGIQYRLPQQDRFRSEIRLHRQHRHLSQQDHQLPATVAANGTFGGNGVKSVIGHPMGAQVATLRRHLQVTSRD
jgi:hypothetical protein